MPTQHVRDQSRRVASTDKPLQAARTAAASKAGSKRHHHHLDWYEGDDDDYEKGGDDGKERDKKNEGVLRRSSSGGLSMTTGRVFRRVTDEKLPLRYDKGIDDVVQFGTLTEYEPMLHGRNIYFVDWVNLPSRFTNPPNYQCVVI